MRHEPECVAFQGTRRIGEAQKGEALAIEVLPILGEPAASDGALGDPKALGTGSTKAVHQPCVASRCPTVSTTSSGCTRVTCPATSSHANCRHEHACHEDIHSSQHLGDERSIKAVDTFLTLGTGYCSQA
jgi:hypothetical protein